jgi:Zn-finger nucleic acid-binding protein
MSDILECPRCSIPLRQGFEPPVSGCPNCGGVFYDPATLKRVLQEARLHAETTPYRRPILSLTEPVRYLRCPACQDMMHRRNFAESSGVVVDVCTRDGVWFDDGELALILHFCSSGQMAKSEKLSRLRQQARKDLNEFSAELRRLSPHHHAGHIDPIAAGEAMVGLLELFPDDQD